MSLRRCGSHELCLTAAFAAQRLGDAGFDVAALGPATTMQFGRGIDPAEAVMQYLRSADTLARNAVPGTRVSQWRLCPPASISATEASVRGFWKAYRSHMGL